MFIIIGILILVIVLIGIYLSEISSKGKLQVSTETDTQFTLESQSIKDNIDRCVQITTDKVIRLMAGQGFYLDIPSGGFRYERTNYSYWVKDTVNILPSSLNEMKDEMTDYIENNLDSCINFESFRNNGWSISSFNPDVKFEILNESVKSEVSYTITVKKSNFERDFSNSIYTPNIKFRDLYIKSIDFVNNQLLRPDFYFNNPFEGYNFSGYNFSYIRLDNKTLLFSIVDGSSKLLEGVPFTLKFAASFDTNSVARTYAAGSRFLFSPDRLALLFFAHGSPAPITIRQYEVDSVSRLQTFNTKVNADVTAYSDTSFPTKLPIYRFSPNGLNFSEDPAILIINLNQDQKQIVDDFGLILFYQDAGWLPYAHSFANGTITTMVFGFR